MSNVLINGVAQATNASRLARAKVIVFSGAKALMELSWYSHFVQDINQRSRFGSAMRCAGISICAPIVFISIPERSTIHLR